MKLFEASENAGNISANKATKGLLAESMRRQQMNVIKYGGPIYVGAILVTLAGYAAALQMRERALGRTIAAQQIARELTGSGSRIRRRW